MTAIRYWQCIGRCSLALLSFGAAAQDSPPPQWGPHADVEVKPGSKRTLGEADLFFPIAQDARSLIFANLRGRFDDNSSHEGNFGLGLRQMRENGWNLGAYGYFDRRRSDTGNYFNQATLGAEALGRDWDFRANGYLPLGTSVRDLGTASSAAISGAAIQVTTTTREERALKGFDAELGWRAPLFDSEGPRQLRLYLGGYHFSGGGITVQGPRMRAELSMTRLPWFGRDADLFLSAEAQDDSARGSQTFVSLRLRIPLGKEVSRSRRLNAQKRRMTAPIVRDVDIVTQSHVTSTLVETGTATAGGQTITVLNSTSTSGASLQAALNTAGANSTVVLKGTFNTTVQTNMSAGQTLIGAGTLTVKTPTGYTATLNLPGATIAAATDATQNVLRMANNATLDGVTITNTYSGGSSSAVNAQSLTGVTIKNSTLSASGSSGSYTVDALNSTNLVFSGNTISATSSGGASGIGIRALSSNNLSIVGNTFNMTGATQYVVAGDNTTVFNTAASTGNATNSGACFFTGAPTGSVGFSTITCP